MVKMKRCPNCGRINDDNKVYCDLCGAPLNEKKESNTYENNNESFIKQAEKPKKKIKLNNPINMSHFSIKKFYIGIGIGILSAIIIFIIILIPKNGYKKDTKLVEDFIKVIEQQKNKKTKFFNEKYLKAIESNGKLDTGFFKKYLDLYNNALLENYSTNGYTYKVTYNLATNYELNSDYVSEISKYKINSNKIKDYRVYEIRLEITSNGQNIVKPLAYLELCKIGSKWYLFNYFVSSDINEVLDYACSLQEKENNYENYNVKCKDNVCFFNREKVTYFTQCQN